MKDKNEIAVLVICIGIILILIGLTVKISLDSKKYDCNACSIEFKTITAGERATGIQQKLPININLSELYYGYMQDKCYVTWDKNSGYMKHG